MPPTKALPQDYVTLFERWVAGGAPNTAADAAAVSPAEGGAGTTTPEPAETTTP